MSNTKPNSLKSQLLRRCINTSNVISEDGLNISDNDVSDIKVESNMSQNDISLDLSLKKCWIIVHYPFSDPGNEYEILSEKDLECDSWETLEKGVAVSVKYGNAKVQGYVVTVSDDYKYLKTHFKSITEEYDKENFNNRKKARKSRPRKKKVISYPENHSIVEERLVIKVMDRETQTDIESTQSTDNTLANIEYLELKRKYEELKNEYEKFNSLFTDVKIGLQNTMVKLDNVNFSPQKNRHLFNSTPKINALKPQNSNSDPKLRSNSKINRTLYLNESDVMEDKENYNPNEMIQIGSKGTKIPHQVYNNIKWENYSAATRKLLITLFPRDVLATHSLSGRPSPAFLTSDKQTKMRLTPNIIADIVEVISTKCAVSEALVRNVITTKCADENKMLKKRQEKRKSNENNESNLTDDVKRLKQK